MLFRSDGCVSALDFTTVFQYCTNITSIPSGLFDNCPLVTKFNGSFVEAGVTSIPSGLFANNTAVLSFNRTFFKCPLTSINSDIFDNCVNVTDFSYVFYRVGAQMTGIAPELWNRVSTPTGTGAFDSATGLTNYGDIPSSWGGA